MIDRPGLADFLRRWRELLRPADVGLPEGARRRTPGLRREEVAQLAGVSTDHYSRLEQARGSAPSAGVVVALACPRRTSATCGRRTRAGPVTVTSASWCTTCSIAAPSSASCGSGTRHQVAVRQSDVKSFIHPEVGLIRLHCEVLLTPDEDVKLLAYFPVEGIDAAEKLELLRVIGTQDFQPAT